MLPEFMNAAKGPFLQAILTNRSNQYIISSKLVAFENWARVITTDEYFNICEIFITLAVLILRLKYFKKLFENFLSFICMFAFSHPNFHSVVAVLSFSVSVTAFTNSISCNQGSNQDL